MIPIWGKKFVGSDILPLIIEDTISNITPVNTTFTLVLIQYVQKLTIQIEDID